MQQKDVSVMCNLSEGVFERGEARGKAEVILNMNKKGYTIEQIADVTEKDVEEVKAIIEKYESVLA
jgi:predicted transposase YdaD